MEIGENDDPFRTSDFPTFGRLVFMAKYFWLHLTVPGWPENDSTAGFYLTDPVFQCLCKYLEFPRFYRATLTHKTPVVPARHESSASIYFGFWSSS